MDKWRHCCLSGDVLKEVKYSQIISIKLDNYLVRFKQGNFPPESLIIIWENSGDLLSDFQKIQYRLLSLCESFALLLYQLTDLRLPNCNSHSVQYAAVSQLDMNEIAAMKVHLRSANEMQTGDCTTAGRITERIVRCCSSVIIQQQCIYCMVVKDKEGKIHPPIRPEVSFCNLDCRRCGWSRPHPGRFPPGERSVTHCARGWFDPRASADYC